MPLYHIVVDTTHDVNSTIDLTDERPLLEIVDTLAEFSTQEAWVQIGEVWFSAKHIILISPDHDEMEAQRSKTGAA